MTTRNSLDDQQIGEALAQSGMPIDLIALMAVLSVFGEEPPLCDCPPGMCLGEGPASDLLDDEDDGEDDEFDIVFDPDFELSGEAELSPEDKVEAVAQFGRIVEGLTTVVEIHAKLLKDLVG